ncbi:hypothetical protein BJY04DRAFT_127737 [Aspergillus karnatakaensis]|uniref:uncharacterized protein n=1 Tax=Aspergillus karnatakaensis TaxID=1810916 RepID=UPI003CCDBBD8
MMEWPVGKIVGWSPFATFLYHGPFLYVAILMECRLFNFLLDIAAQCATGMNLPRVHVVSRLGEVCISGDAARKVCLESNPHSRNAVHSNYDI